MQQEKISFRIIILFFFSWRIVDFLIIMISGFFFPKLGFFPYKEVALADHMPHVFTTLANFDGVQYLIIAREGYYTYNQAYFPLYPLLIRFLSPLFFSNFLLTSIVISNVLFLVGLYMFTQFLQHQKYKRAQIFIILSGLLLFPTSFFFGATYTESLFFFLLTTSLYFYTKKKYLLAAFFGLSSALSRLIGLFLSLVFITELAIKRNFKEIKYKLLVIVSPVIGFVIYTVYLYKTTGDPLFFFSSQPAFGANRSTSLVFLPQVVFRYAKILVTAEKNYQYFIALFELVVFLTVFSALLYQLFLLYKKKENSLLLGLNLFSFITILLPTLTGTLSSIPRYSLLALSFFILLGDIRNKIILYALYTIFVILHIIILGFFSQGNFVA